MDEINDIGNVIANTIDNKGEDKRNFFGILRAQRGATDLYNISGDSLNLLNEAYKSNKIGADEYKEGLRNIIEATGNDLGLNVSLVYLDTSTMPKDSEGSTGSSYIVDRKNRKVLIPIDVNKIEDIKELLGTLTEEVAHGKDALEGRQDKKVAEDKSNDEEGLETLGRPANEYVKKKFGEDNNSKIKLTTDGIDLSNADVGEKVGDVITPEDRKDRSNYVKRKYFTSKRIDKIADGFGDIFIGGFTIVAGTIAEGLTYYYTGGIGYLLVKGTTTSAYVVGANRALAGLAKVGNGIYGSEVREDTLNPIRDMISPKYQHYYDEYEFATMFAVGEAAAFANNLNQGSQISNKETAKLEQRQGEGQNPQQGQRSQDNLAQNNKNSINKTQAQGNQDYSGNQQISKGSTSNNQQGAPISKTLDMKDNLASQVSNNMSYGQTLSLPVKYPIVTKSGVTLYKGYAMGPRGAKYTEVGVSNNKEIVYKNSNGSYFKLTDNGLENISSKDVIKKEYFPTVKVQKNNGSNPSAGKNYYVSKEGNFKVKKYIEAGQTIEDYDKKYLVENARARGINVGRSKEHTNTTLGHWEKAVDIADEASKDPNVKAVYVDEALRNISDKFKDDKTIPDVTIEYKDGTFKLIEVQSKTDTEDDLTNKLKNIQDKYGEDVITNYKVEKPKGGK
ncbi:hypothetical protein VKN79_04375 [Fusobacterium polymorphum]|nr:hypothetical protein [Fusobacterium polymorphum]WRL78504.1 hypothetical protein VKN79_04375 [Fusobacterium polymorphum]